MSAITIVVLIFSLIGAFDKLIGDKFGIGKEFEKGFKLFAPMAMAMLGMLVLAPAIGVWLMPFFEKFYSFFGIDPSIIPASLFANDMGGMTLSQTVCKSQSLGNFNGFVVSSMMGCVISFTIPFSTGIVNKSQHKELFFGLLCGIVTIPIGCLVSGLLLKIKIGELILNLLPLIIFSIIIGVLLIFFTNTCIKIFSVFGTLIRIVAIIGLVCAIFTFLTKIEINKNFDTLENAAFVCVNASVTLSGALPFMFILSKLLDKPMNKIGSKIGIDGVSALALLSTLVTNATTFGLMDKMNKKGAVLNSAFATSAAFTFGGHLALTMAFNSDYVVPMIIGKIVSGISSVLLALLLYKDDSTAEAV